MSLLGPDKNFNLYPLDDVVGGPFGDVACALPDDQLHGSPVSAPAEI